MCVCVRARWRVRDLGDGLVFSRQPQHLPQSPSGPPLLAPPCLCGPARAAGTLRIRPTSTQTRPPQHPVPACPFASVAAAPSRAHRHCRHPSGGGHCGGAALRRGLGPAPGRCAPTSRRRPAPPTDTTHAAASCSCSRPAPVAPGRRGAPARPASSRCWKRAVAAGGQARSCCQPAPREHWRKRRLHCSGLRAQAARGTLLLPVPPGQARQKVLSARMRMGAKPFAK